jgi:UDP-N-acetylglucosamine:LPS N-acetylglucosamine transferase
MKNIKIVAPLSSLSERTRLYKLTLFLHDELGYKNIAHVGWERIPGEREEKRFDFPIDKKIILEGGGYGTGKVKWLYFMWMIKTFFYCFKFGKNDIVWALGFESAFPVMLASKIKRYKVVFDDADRFSMLFKFPSIIDKILKFLEKLTSRNVTFHVVPGDARYNFKSKKFYVLKNTPSESQLEKAKQISENLEKPASFVININGWLGSGRGMNEALQLVNRLEDEDLKILLIGKLDCEAANKLAEHKNVIYKGKMSNAETLANYFISDLVLTYYDPKLEINQYAESNKWGDAIKTGIGIIVNEEVKSAKFIKENNLGVIVPYHDIEALASEIQKLLADSTKLEALKSNAKQYSYIMPYYEDQLKELFKKINNEETR